MIKIVSRDQLYEGCKVRWASLSDIDKNTYTMSSIQYTDDPFSVRCVMTWDGGTTKYYMLITNFVLVSEPLVDLDQDDDDCI